MRRTTRIASPSRLFIGWHLVSVVVGLAPLEPASPVPRLSNGSTHLRLLSWLSARLRGAWLGPHIHTLRGSTRASMAVALLGSPFHELEELARHILRPSPPPPHKFAPCFRPLFLVPKPSLAGFDPFFYSRGCNPLPRLPPSRSLASAVYAAHSEGAPRRAFERRLFRVEKCSDYKHPGGFRSRCSDVGLHLHQCSPRLSSLTLLVRLPPAPRRRGCSASRMSTPLPECFRSLIVLSFTVSISAYLAPAIVLHLLKSELTATTFPIPNAHCTCLTTQHGREYVDAKRLPR